MDKEVFGLAKVRDFEDSLKRLVEANETLMIRVGEDIGVGEAVEAKVTDRALGFLQKVIQAFSQFELQEVEVSIPHVAKLKFVRKKKE